jgi:hypothetical protein
VAVWDNPAVTAAIGIAAGAATAYIQSALAARAKTGEELRDRREEVYPSVWLLTSAVSSYPPAEIRWRDLVELHLALRAWYYETGGLYMSESTRHRFGDAQEVIGAYLHGHEALGPDARIDDADYEAVAATCSAFRTALTEDLATRRQRSFLLTVKSRRWHRREQRKAKARIERFGEQPWRCPLPDMRLQSSTSPSKIAKPAP